jgi:hypothetical protein
MEHVQPPVSPLWQALPHLVQLVSALDLGQVSILLWIVLGLAILLLGLLLALIWRIARVMRNLQEANRQGEEHSAVAKGTLPLTCFRRDGQESDPLNLRIIATPAQLGSAFAEAGWYRADELTFVTAARITFDALLARTYSTAPVSDLFLYGRQQDFAFERPGRNVRERDHVRFWDTGLRAIDGRPLWVGAATRDISLRLAQRTRLPTHRISPNVDAERDVIVEAIVGAGWVIQQEMVPGFGVPTERTNGFGDWYSTDGQVAVLVLANVPVLFPFVATNVHGGGAAIVHALNRVLRWRLPRVGRERAERQERRREAQRARRERQEKATVQVPAGPPDES